MRITTKGRYAIRAITNLALSDTDKPKPIKLIAQEEGISPEFLEQIFFRLKKTGIISSVRGPGGGFRIAKSHEEINVKDIFEAVGEGVDLTPCTCEPDSANELPKNPNAYTAAGCNRKDICLVTDIWQQASQYIQDYFTQLTLAKIVASIKSGHTDPILQP